MGESNRSRVKAKVDPQLGPVEALGVALSIPMSNTDMMKCQELAKPMLAHLARLGWFLLSDAKDEAIRDEVVELRRQLEDARRRQWDDVQSIVGMVWARGFVSTKERAEEFAKDVVKLCAPNPRAKSKRDEDELAQVRADITRTAAVVSALCAALDLYGDQSPPKNETDALSEQENRLRALLVREREQMNQVESNP